MDNVHVPENNARIVAISIAILFATYGIDALLRYVSGFYYAGNGERLHTLLYVVLSPLILYLYSAIILVRLTRPHYYLSALGVGFGICTLKLLERLASDVDIALPEFWYYVSEYAQIAMPFLVFCSVGYVYQNRRDDFLSEATVFRTINAYVVIGIFIVLVFQNRWYVQKDYYQVAQNNNLVFIDLNQGIDSCAAIIDSDLCKSSTERTDQAVCQRLISKNYCE